MQIAIVDDCEKDREELRRLTEQYLAAREVSAELTLFSSGEELLSGDRPGGSDILLLDLYLSGMSGMDAAREVRERSGRCQIVFITNSDAYAVDGYEVEAAGYLLKPVRPEALERTLDRCLHHMDVREDRYIEVVSGRRSVRIPLRSIIWISVQLNAVLFHTGDVTVKSYMAFRDITAALEKESRFLTCNKGMMVNMDRVAAIDGDEFLMDSGERVPIRRRDSRQLRHEYVQYVCQRESLLRPETPEEGCYEG